MVHVYRITVGLLLYVALIYVCKSSRETQASAAAEVMPAQPTSFAELFPAHGVTPAERDAFQREQALRLEQMASLEAKKAQREQALGARPERMVRLKQTIRVPWKDIINTNYARFENLKKEAAAAPSHQVACTICDGKSYMPCVLCSGKKQCSDCLGMGELAQGRSCPVCMGSGKCSLCSGYGKMLCPFCDDGTIHAHHAAPRAEPWLE